MKTFLLIKSATGPYLLKNVLRCDVIEKPSPIPANLVRVDTVLAKTKDDVVAKFNLQPYVAPADKTVAQCIAAAEAHITKAFGPLIVSDGLERIFKAQLEGTLASIPKTVAVAGWIKTVKALALAGGTEFPAAPHTVVEVLAE